MSFQIHYYFRFENGVQVEVPIALDERTLTWKTALHPSRKKPEWALLTNHQCDHCPFAPDQNQLCPIAQQLIPVVDLFSHICATESLTLQVVTPQRTVSQVTTADKAITSLLGVVIASSGCPHTDYFKPMLRYHLPLAEVDETVYRATSMYLLAQYFRRRNGMSADFELRRLVTIYQNMQLINHNVAKRLAEACEANSTISGVLKLNAFVTNMSVLLEASLSNIEPSFAPYLR